MKKVAVITGGASGIGKCLVKTLAERGMSVSFIDHDKPRLERTAAETKSSGLQVESFHGDIADEGTLRAFVEWVIAKHPDGVDLLVNNACISRRGLLSDCTMEDFNYVLNVGVSAPFMLTKLLMKSFKAKASIVNIASSRAFMSQKDTESYTAAKGGIIALTHAMAMSLSGKVRVNSISPGWIDTGKYHDENYKPTYSPSDIAQHPSGRVGEPEDIAGAVLFLADERNAFINGENLVIDGGMTKQMIYHNDHGWKLGPE